EEVVSRVWDSCFLSDETPRRGRRVATDGLQPLDELHRLEQPGAGGNPGEREPRDRRGIRRATIGDGADHPTTTTVALPRRTAEVCGDLALASRIGVDRRRRR